MKRILFYATRADITAVTSVMEATHSLRYIQMGNFLSTSLSEYSSASDIPGLGFADADSSTACSSFLMVKDGEPIQRRYVNGKNRILIDQLDNPRSIEFCPAGLRGSSVLLHGRFATASDEEMSAALMRDAAKVVRRHFKKVKAFHVGPEALDLLNQGVRLTMSANAGREYDLTLT